MLKTNRSFWTILLLTIVTCGIYSYFLIYEMANEANQVDEGGKNVGGLIAFILLSAITCGIYAIYWYYTVCEKFANSVRRSGMAPSFGGAAFLLWSIVGSLLCGLGPIIAEYKMIQLWNQANTAYNTRHAG